ncbi:MAG TPA: hypothetical protein VEI57_04380 [Nitrospirota bacterium]|nr:hypothetical protein [Nitrospirota bacterium]
MKKLVIAVFIALLVAVPAMATTTFQLPTSQDDFKNLTRDLGLAISYDPLSPAEPLGGLLPGIDAGVEVTTVKINRSASYWQNSVTNPSSLPNYLFVPKVHVQVGLPVIPLDIGVEFATVPGTDINVIGGELKYAILSGGIVMPAVAIRGAYTRLSGIDVFDMETKSLDLSISKGFVFITPYVGLGQVWITGTPKGATTLSTVNSSETKEFIGMKFSVLPILNIVAEGDFAKVNAYSLRLNLHF